jgi:hypothetical protein
MVTVTDPVLEQLVDGPQTFWSVSSNVTVPLKVNAPPAGAGGTETETTPLAAVALNPGGGFVVEPHVYTGK